VRGIVTPEVMVMRPVAACVLVATMGGLVCNCGAPSDDVVILPDALTCPSSNWNVIHDFGGLRARPAALTAWDGKLYVSIVDLGIVSLPATGGEPMALSLGAASQIWFRGENLYYTQDGGGLWQAPIEGGNSALVREARTLPWMSTPQTEFGVAVDANHFYWILGPDPATYDDWIERTALADGTTQQVATLPRPTAKQIDGLAARLWAASGDTFFAVPAPDGGIYAIPLAGGAMRTLGAPLHPAGATLYALGVNSGGVLWSVESRVTRTAAKPIDSKSSLALSDLADPPGAAARAFWPDKPVGLRVGPARSLADGDRGWIATGTETLADGSRHVSVWSVDAAGNGARVGCGPTLLSQDSGNVVTAAATSNAVYAVVETEPDPPDYYAYPTYALLRLDRAPSVPAAP
jgi:hypothetical protein